MRSSASVFLIVIFLAILSTFADACVLNGPRYRLASDTVHWFLELSDGETCLRGVRFNNVVVDKLMVVSAPRTGHVTLQGTGFSYKAARDSQGRDFFSLMVAGATNKVPGSSTIEVEVSVSNAGESRRFSTMIPRSSQAQPSQPSPAPSTSSPPSGASAAYRPFTPLHTYYMAASGCSDANAGTSPASPWCTANHAVVCGDVIIAAAGSYNTRRVLLGNNGGRAVSTVSNCPSTSGGIDGKGGIYFAVILCGGSDLEACKVNYTCTGAGCRAVFDSTASNWAIEGFKVTTSDAANDMCFESNAIATLSTVLHHFAAINNICYSSGQGFASNDNGNGGGTPAPGTDYMAAVGNIMQAASSLTAFGVCTSAIDGNGMANFDTNAGTHLYFYGNFVANSQSPTCVTGNVASDSEAIMLDTWNTHFYTGTGVIANNMAWHSMRACLQFTFNPFAGDNNLNITFHNNTCFDDNTNIGGPTGPTGGGELDFSGNNGTTSVHINYSNNIAYSDLATSGGRPSPVYAAVWGGNTMTNLVNGTTGTENILKGSAAVCQGTCDPGNNVGAFNGNGLGTNFYENPNFNNTTNLKNNWVTFTPNCAGFRNATACMGWNAETRTLTSLTPISDLTPTSTHSPGKGYQLPSTTCNTNSEYPTWLKGIVYLHYDGTFIRQYRDLVTVPCGL